MRPNADQVEVTLLGPGYGECVVIHLGNGHWALIDSCVDSDTGRPAALSYLEGIGVDPATAVRLVLATHWHDDHVRGMGSPAGRRKEAAADWCVATRNRRPSRQGIAAALRRRV